MKHIRIHFKDALVEAENICFKKFEITKTKPKTRNTRLKNTLIPLQ